MDGTRGDRAPGARVVVGGAHGNDLVAVAVPGLEARAGDVRPAPDGARPGAVVGAVGGAGLEHVEDGGGHVAGEGEPSQLVVHDGHLAKGVLGVGHPVGEGAHGPDEVVPVADDPG